MKVDAVSGIGFRNGNINFGEKQRVHEGAPVSRPSGVSDLAKVPVIVLLAMNPATLNSALPTMPETANPNKITILAPENITSPAQTYVIDPLEIEQSRPRNPFGWAYLRDGKIQYNSKVKVNDNREMDLVYFTRTGVKKIENEVFEIFIIDPQKKGSAKLTPHPPRIQKIIYHDIGKDKEYCSVITKGHLTNDSGSAIGNEYQEIKIDDDTANKLLAFTLGKSEWENDTDIEFETTTREGINQPKVEYFK